MIKISLKNIGKLLKKNRLFILLICSQLIAVNIIYFVYGIYTSYDASKQELTINTYTLSASFEDGQEPTMNECRECFEEIFGEVQNRMDYFFIFGGYDDEIWQIHNEYKDGKYGFAKSIRENMGIKEGRFFEEEEIRNGSKVIIIEGKKVGEVGTEYREYNIIGRLSALSDDTRKMIEVSYLGYPDDAEIDMITIGFRKLPRQTDYLKFKNTLEGTFGDKIHVEEFPLKDAEELMSINSIMLFAIIIGIAMALDTGLLYGYIISRRRKQMAVFGLTGARRIQLFIINEAEILIVSVVTLLSGMILFKLAFENIVVKKMYELETKIYTFNTYAKLALIYLVCMLIVTSVITYIYSDSNIMNMLRRREK